MKKYFAIVALAAMLGLSSCSKSAVDTFASAVEDLADVCTKDDLTADKAVAALESATAEIKKAAELAKKDPEKAKADMKVFQESARGKAMEKMFDASKGNKFNELAVKEPKVQAAAIGLVKAALEFAAACGGGIM